MNELLRTCVILALVCFALAAFASAEGQASGKLELFDGHRLSGMFGKYGDAPGYVPAYGRFILPADTNRGGQAGIYSYFALSGDFEVTFRYGLDPSRFPCTGDGSAVGIVVDAEDGTPRARLQRRCSETLGSGYFFDSFARGNDSNDGESEDHFVGSECLSGRIGLRRIGSEIIFLRAEGSELDLAEIGRLPFTDRTVRKIRIFVISGPSASPVDVQIGLLQVKAEEITGGVPARDLVRDRSWWLWIVPIAISIVLLTFWGIQRRRNRS